MTAPTPSLRIAVLLSGTGRTLANLLRRRQEGRLEAQIVAVASNKIQAAGLEIAREAKIPVASFPLSAYATRSDRDRALWAWVRSHEVDLVLLAGYLTLLDLSEGHGLPVLNIHPSLLPRHGGPGYFGARVHAAVLEAGDRESGCTVHLVDEQYDHGQILAQRSVRVLEDDDVDRLAARVFEAECELFPSLINAIVRGEISLRDRGRSR